ncbi:TMEM175 family protein [Chitinophagaceae bacterium MMS25-I14]
MPEKNYNQFAGQKVARIEALSDGVFAIALTLLVLEIKVPEGHVNSEQELWHMLAKLAPKFLSYFLSFMTMGIFWTGHALQLSYMERYNRDLNWNSLFFLLLVSLLPFTTAFLGEHIEFKTAIALYWLNILLLGIILYIHWNYACKNHFIAVDGEEFNAIDKAVRKRIIVAQVLYFAGGLLCFVNTYLSISFIIVVQLNYAFAIFSGRLPKKLEKC